MEEPDFWDSADKAQGYVKELKNLKDIVEGFNALIRQQEDIETLIEMAYEENDASLISEIESALKLFVEEFEELRLNTLLSDEYDKYNAI
jgi:peptide chain release factor 2